MVQNWSSESATCPGEHEWLKSKKRMERRAQKERENCQASLMGCRTCRWRRKRIQFSLPLTDCRTGGQISNHRKIISKRRETETETKHPCWDNQPGSAVVWVSNSHLYPYAWFHYHQCYHLTRYGNQRNVPSMPPLPLHSFVPWMYHGCSQYSLPLLPPFTATPPAQNSFKWQTVVPELEKAMAPHFSTLAWKIPGMEEPGRLQSMGSLRVGNDWATSLSLFPFMHWRRKW